MVIFSVYSRWTVRKILGTNQRNYGNTSFSKCRQLKIRNNVNVILNSNRQNAFSLRKTQSCGVYYKITINTQSRLMSSFPSFSTNDYKGID